MEDIKKKKNCTIVSWRKKNANHNYHFQLEKETGKTQKREKKSKTCIFKSNSKFHVGNLSRATLKTNSTSKTNHSCKARLTAVFP